MYNENNERSFTRPKIITKVYAVTILLIKSTAFRLVNLILVRTKRAIFSLERDKASDNAMSRLYHRKGFG